MPEQTDETIILVVRPHWIYKFQVAILAALGLLLPLWVLTVSRNSHFLTRFDPAQILLIYVIFAALVVVGFTWRWLNLSHKFGILTDRRLITLSGVVGRLQAFALARSAIKQIDLVWRSSLWRKLGVGTLRVISDQNQLVLAGVGQLENLAQQIVTTPAVEAVVSAEAEKEVEPFVVPSQLQPEPDLSESTMDLNLTDGVITVMPQQPNSPTIIQADDCGELEEGIAVYFSY